MLNQPIKTRSEYDRQFEVGGNYLELIEFTLLRQLPGPITMVGLYGINVAKVREVVHMPRINPLASRVPGIAGIFELRGVPIPAVNLCRVLGDEGSPVTPDQQIIVAEFSLKRAGFIVQRTNRIRRVPWEKVLPPSADGASWITGMILVEKNEFLFILDLEQIIAHLELHAHGDLTQHHTGPLMPPLPSVSSSSPLLQQAELTSPEAPGILLVDDSNLILGNISRTLVQEGWRVLMARNGLEALQILEQTYLGKGHRGPIHAILTDLEMPQMDGLNLLRSIRSQRQYDKLPVYFHTSQSDSTSRDLAQKAGVNGFFVKNDVINIIETLKTHFIRIKLVG